MLTPNIALVNLAKCIGSSPTKAAEIAGKWKMSTDERRQLVTLCQFMAREFSLDQLKRFVVFNQISRQDVVNVMAADFSLDEINTFNQWETPVFPVSGDSVMETFKLSPGPAVGDKMLELKNLWADQGYPETFNYKELS